MAKAPTNVPSYVHGASEIPLLGETIGRNLDRTVARVPDRDALVSVHQGIRLTTRSSSPPSRRSPAACWRSASSRASGSASGRPTTPSGRSCRTVISIRRPHAQTRQINKSTARQPRRPMPPTKDLRGFGATPDPGGDDVADADDAHELAALHDGEVAKPVVQHHVEGLVACHVRTGRCRISRHPCGNR
jgi:hypothetical protein